MAKIRYWMHWLFQDLTARKGKYVIAEVPNWPLVTFMIAIILSVIVYPGPVQKFLMIVALIALALWGWLEWRSGRSRFRKLLGILGLIGVVGAAFLMFAK